MTFSLLAGAKIKNREESEDGIGFFRFGRLSYKQQ